MAVEEERIRFLQGWDQWEVIQLQVDSSETTHIQATLEAMFEEGRVEAMQIQFGHVWSSQEKS